MPNLHLIKVTFLGQTSRQPDRISLKSERFKGNKKIVIFDQSYNKTIDFAKDYLCKNGFNIIGVSYCDRIAYIVSNTFKAL